MEKKRIDMERILRQAKGVNIITSLRTDGKTTGTYVYMLKNGIEFALLFRTLGECKDCHLIFENAYRILGLPPEKLFTKKIAESFYCVFHEDGRVLCWCLPIDNAEKIKKKSDIFNKVQFLILDEYQSLTGKYCKNEIGKVMNIQTSIARGYGEYSRNVPLILLGNFITALNPWSIEYGLTDMRMANAKKEYIFIEKENVLAVNHFNIEASKAILANETVSSLGGSREIKSALGEYMYDGNAFIYPKVKSKKFKYIATIITDNAVIGLRHYGTFLHCGSPDMSFTKVVYTPVKDKQTDDILLLTPYCFPAKLLKTFYSNSSLYFKSFTEKNEILKILTINLISY